MRRESLVAVVVVVHFALTFCGGDHCPIDQRDHMEENEERGKDRKKAIKHTSHEIMLMRSFV